MAGLIKKIMIIAGEASGDLHGGALVDALKGESPNLELFGIGGDLMRSAGMELYYHVNDLAYIGFTEVAKHYFFFRRVFDRMLDLVKERKPDLLVLIDYPGFNLRFARMAKKKEGVKTFYYIAPQVWAWGQGRAKKMARFIDKMAVIFDFEVPFFKKYGIDAEFVGHPLLEELKNRVPSRDFFKKYHLEPGLPLLALLPGSRYQEISNLLPMMLESARIIKKDHPELQVAISRAPSAHTHFSELVPKDSAKLVTETYDLLEHATAAIVASGTATLETALFDTPFVITYRVSPLSYWISKRLVKLDYIGLVNVVSGERVVPEFIQHNATPENIVPALKEILFDKQARTMMIEKLGAVGSRLGSEGAVVRTARLILDSC